MKHWWEKVEETVPRNKYPALYQSYMKYRQLVGWIFVEEWWAYDVGRYACVAFRERLWIRE